MITDFFKQAALNNNININDYHIDKFSAYMDLLKNHNNAVNLTAITDDKQIVLKHFIDSLTVSPYIKGGASVIDVGSGAGFPGVPLKIYNDTICAALLECQQKRVSFLRLLIQTLNLSNVQIVNLRAEQAGASNSHREKYDYAVSRAVAPLSVLCEYCLPLVKTGGKFIAMKGKGGKDEIKCAQTAISLLGGAVSCVDCRSLYKDEHERVIIVIEKTNNTPVKFPRRPGIPTKRPL